MRYLSILVNGGAAALLLVWVGNKNYRNLWRPRSLRRRRNRREAGAQQRPQLLLHRLVRRVALPTHKICQGLFASNAVQSANLRCALAATFSFSKASWSAPVSLAWL